MDKLYRASVQSLSFVFSIFQFVYVRLTVSIIADQSQKVNMFMLDCVIFFVLFLQVIVDYMGVHHSGI